MKRAFASFALMLVASPVLSGCGLRPLYAGGAAGTTAQRLGNVEIAPVEGKGGWLVRNALQDRLDSVSGGNGPSYRLVVTLDDQITGIGLRLDDAVTRERRTLRARYQLFDQATGAVVMDATAGSDAGIDVSSSEYATITAEDTALERLAEIVADQIINRMARQIASESAPAPTPASTPTPAPKGQ